MTENKDGGAVKTLPSAEIEISFYRSGDNNERLVIKATLFSREQISKLMRALEVWGPDMPSDGTTVRLNPDQLSELHSARAPSTEGG